MTLVKVHASSMNDKIIVTTCDVVSGLIFRLRVFCVELSHLKIFRVRKRLY